MEEIHAHHTWRQSLLGQLTPWLLMASLKDDDRKSGNLSIRKEAFVQCITINSSGFSGPEQLKHQGS